MKSKHDLIDISAEIQEAVSTSAEQLTESQSQITTTEQMLDEQEVRLQEYSPLATRMACMYRGLKRLSQVLPIYLCPLPEFVHIYGETGALGRNQKGNRWTRKAQVHELVTSVSRTVYARLAGMLLEEHGLIMSVLVVLETLIADGNIKRQDTELFFASGDATTEMPHPDRPSWITKKVQYINHIVSMSQILWVCAAMACIAFC